MVNLKNHKKFLVALTVFAIAQFAIIALKWDRPLVWDSSVYIGMGKHLFSLGRIGFWESFRPPILPLLIGSIWKAGLFFPNLARLLGTAISMAGLAAVYSIVKKDFDQELALYTALILMSSMVYLRWTHYFLTGIPAAFLAFAAIHCAHNRKEIKSGFFVALGFLTRFPAALAGLVAGITILISIIPLKELINLKYTKQKIKQTTKSLTKLGVAFGIPTVVYLGFNEVIGKGFLSPIIGGASVPTLNPEKYFYGFYFLKEAIITNPLILLAPLGLLFALKIRDKNFYGYGLGLLVFYTFFTFYPHKEPRFMLLFLPLLSLFSAYGLIEISLPKDISRYITKERLVAVAVALIFVINFFQVYNMNTWTNSSRATYMSEISDFEGTVAGLNPAPVVYGDFKYIAVRPETYETTSEKAFGEADYFGLETCSWYCTPAIDSCKQKKDELFEKLESETKIFEESANQCSYKIYELNN